MYNFNDQFLESSAIIGSFSIDFNTGTIIGYFNTDDDTFYIEPIDKWNKTIIYKASDVRFPSYIEKKKLLVPLCLKKLSVFEEVVRVKRRSAKKPVKKNRCEVKLIADYHFYKEIGNNNYHSAARHLVSF